MGLWTIIGLSLVAGVGLLVLIPSGVLGSDYAAPREFEYDGETYTWVPDTANVPRLANRYLYGSFLYSDGAPVTDLMTIRLLTEEWVSQCERAEAQRGNL